MGQLKLSTASGGSITLDPTNTASNLTITVPAQTATLATLTTPSFASTIGVGGATAAASGAGITFPATVSSSSDANTLDDYEEGTFTPTVNGGITSPTYSRQVGTYTKIGNLVQFQISIETSGGTRNSNNLQIGNLPFTQGNFTGGVGYTFAFVNNVVNSTTTNLPTVYGDANQTYFSFYKTDSNVFTGNDLQSASFRVDVTGTYRI